MRAPNLSKLKPSRKQSQLLKIIGLIILIPMT
nr:MAG TPA: hypothetical protein [Caudoviricetes sp.]